MKILFDQNVARALRKFTPGHTTLTADKNIRYQQNLKDRKISIIELSTNDWNILKTLPSLYISAVESAAEGCYQTISYPRPPVRPRRQR